MKPQSTPIGRYLSYVWSRGNNYVVSVALLAGLLNVCGSQAVSHDTGCQPPQSKKSSAGGAVGQQGVGSVRAEAVATVSADLTCALHDLPVAPVSTTISTYGKPVTTDVAARTTYARLAAGEIVRIPIRWNHGKPCSSATGGPCISADKWINTIIGMGADPMIVLGGSMDNNFTAVDAGNIAKRYKGRLYGIVLGNEFDNNGLGLATYIDKLFKPAARAIRAVDPSIKIAGPAESSYKANDLRTFVVDCKGLFDIIDYHQYGTGTDAPDDQDLMALTATYESEIDAIKGLLDATGQSKVVIQVGEFNLAWRYNDGVPGGDQRFFASYITAWSASAMGHILRGGARGVAYSQQNGPLGIMVEPGNHDRGHPDGTPMPIYWGLAAFQGAGNFRDFGASIMKTESDDAVDCFAGSSGNIVLVNKTDAAVTTDLTIKGGRSGRRDVWISNTADPYSPPIKTTTVVSGGAAILVLQPYQVVTVLDGPS